MPHGKNSSKIDSLTGMRGIACLSVVCYHYCCLFIENRGLDISAVPFAPYSARFFLYSKNAVELFFLIAGFLTAYHYRSAAKELSFGAYAKRHYVKLLLPSAAMNLWAFANAWLMNGAPTPKTLLRTVLSVLMINTGWFTSSSQTGLPINSTMWYIDVLLLCYLIYFAIRKIARKTPVYVALAAAMVLLGGVCIDLTPGLPFLWNFNGRGYGPFFLGVLLCELQVRVSDEWKKRIAAIWAGFVLCFFAARLIFGFERIFGRTGSALFVRWFEFFGAPGVMFAALNLTPVTRFFEWKPFLWLGALSAAIYYVHNNLLEDVLILDTAAGSHLNYSSGLCFLLLLVGVIPFAVLYRLAEKRLGRLWKNRGRERQTE